MPTLPKDKQHLYMGSVMASRQVTFRSVNEIRTFTVIARSVEEAEGHVFRMMRDQFPTSEGYSHSGRMDQVPDTDVIEWAQVIQEA